MANEGSTKPTYSELEAELLRVRGLLRRQWISVEERLPELNGKLTDYVLVASVNGVTYDRMMAIDGKKVWIHDSDAGFTNWMPLPDPPTFPQSSSLVSQGAESTDIGKLDTADKSGVEMGKVNRVDEIWKACRAAAQEVLWSNISPEELDRAHVQEDITNQANVILKHIQPFLAGSAETGGEKAAWISVDERMPEDGDISVWVCFENGSYYCSARYIDEEWFGYDLQIEDTFHIEQKITHWRPLDFLPTFPRASQNHAVSGGVEGAHEGTTADTKADSREPEKLTNVHKSVACIWCGYSDGHNRACPKIIKALAESSLSSPPPKEKL